MGLLEDQGAALNREIRGWACGHLERADLGISVSPLPGWLPPFAPRQQGPQALPPQAQVEGGGGDSREDRLASGRSVRSPDLWGIGCSPRS